MSWKESILDAFEVFGPLSLAMVSFTEAIIQPVPPDIVYIPMLVNDIGKTEVVLGLWLVITLSSVLGSLVGYLIGQRWGRSLIQRFGSTSHVEKLEALTQRYGTIGIFIAAVSPIPYKVFGWVAGMGEMQKKPFLIAGFLGRGLRFGLEAILIGIYGQQAFDAMMWFLDNEIFLAILLVGAAGAVLAAWNWWNGLEIEAKQSN
jgi:membrane protein YqaA with SNARE-associated domain|tara:strand:- start:682 stop:1290 length:609 start_codon:yes stop_codon:yes gene_type:complete